MSGLWLGHSKTFKLLSVKKVKKIKKVKKELNQNKKKNV